MKRVSLGELDKMLPFYKPGHQYNREYRGEMAINCPTQTLAVKLSHLFNKHGLKWNTGDSYINMMRWESSDMTYHPINGMWGSIEEAKEGNCIIYELQDTSTEIVLQDVNNFINLINSHRVPELKLYRNA